MKKAEAKAVGQRIRQLRGDLTQAEFAERIGITQAMIWNYENGMQMPKANALFRIAQYSGTSIEWLLTGKTAKRGHVLSTKDHINMAAQACRKIGDPEVKEFNMMMELLFKDRRMLKLVLSHYRFIIQKKGRSIRSE